MPNITVGADPEFFLVDKITNKIVSAVGKIPGTKDNPKPLPVGFIQRDNVLGEINIPPASSSAGFYTNTKHTLLYAKGYIQQIVDPNLEILIQASGYLEREQLQSQKSFIFGCSRDYDCWGIDTIERIDPYEVGNFRTCGGHIHIGFNYINIDTIQDVARACDLFIGLPSVLYDDDKKRRSLYGQASRFRPKPYGLEYRTPSNFWLKSDHLIKWIYQQAHASVRGSTLVNGFKKEDVLRIKDTINKSDVEQALFLIKEYGFAFREELMTPEAKEIYAAKYPKKEGEPPKKPLRWMEDLYKKYPQIEQEEQIDFAVQVLADHPPEAPEET